MVLYENYVTFKLRGRKMKKKKGNPKFSTWLRKLSIHKIRFNSLTFIITKTTNNQQKIIQLFFHNQCYSYHICWCCVCSKLKKKHEISLFSKSEHKVFFYSVSLLLFIKSVSNFFFMLSFCLVSCVQKEVERKKERKKVIHKSS